MAGFRDRDVGGATQAARLGLSIIWIPAIGPIRRRRMRLTGGQRRAPEPAATPVPPFAA